MTSIHFMSMKGFAELGIKEKENEGKDFKHGAEREYKAKVRHLKEGEDIGNF